MRASLERVIEIENKEVWMVKGTPERDDEHLLTSHIDMDIWTVRRCTNTSVSVHLKHVDEINETVKRSCGHEGAADDFLLTCVTVCVVSPQNIKGNVVNSRLIDGELEQRVISSCLQELKLFPGRFVKTDAHKLNVLLMCRHKCLAGVI